MTQWDILLNAKRNRKQSSVANVIDEVALSTTIKYYVFQQLKNVQHRVYVFWLKIDIEAVKVMLFRFRQAHVQFRYCHIAVKALIV